MAAKRKIVKDEPVASPFKKVKVEAGMVGLSDRVISLKEGKVERGGVIVYWMSRDQRVQDNYALLHALEIAQARDSQVAVVFNLLTEFLGAGARQFDFMLKGLRELESNLDKLGIPFFLVQGDPVANLPPLMDELNCHLLVCDFSPLRVGRLWREGVAKGVGVPVHEVDAHNIVPMWVASDKQETGARTIRPKINRLLPTYLTEFPKVERQAAWKGKKPDMIDWDGLIKAANERGGNVPAVDWLEPGEAAAHDALRRFLGSNRLKLYDTKRNDPNVPEAQSGLSPYLHFGMISSQRTALEANKLKPKHQKAVEGFIEESVVRKELSDNYCWHNKNYDSVQGAAGWAQDTLKLHTADKREYVYTQEQLEWAKTHDELWNAAQKELVFIGKMHGFMRMYWAKKILEWTSSPEEALRIAILLNDKYSIDGRDPNGYVGCMWSICGVHDMGWTERPIFGKIRYMNYNGCKRKFKIDTYVDSVKRRVAKVKTKAPSKWWK
mmetsp:Transcript_8714/g.32143  ORF Transcript_8714/g.32143 Transcript_8714/m.32143 type:complete len:495 (+) Transcript_8714:319-1803(+)